MGLLTEALYFEARGETVKGQFAVAEVILNRVSSPSFPDTICGVINQGTGRKFACQFTYTCDGRAEVIREPKAYEMVGKVAKMVMDGMPRTLTDGATFYHTKAVRPRWAAFLNAPQPLGFTISTRNHYAFPKLIHTRRGGKKTAKPVRRLGMEPTHE